MVAVPLTLLGLCCLTVAGLAEGPQGPQTSPTGPAAPAPSSQPSAGVNNGQLLAGAQGVYQPIPPSTLRPDPSISDPVVPHSAFSSSAPPQPAACTPGNAAPPPPSSLSHKQNLTIYPTFTRNAAGGYDGSDPAFGYYQPNAIPPGGDASQTQLGAAATAANIAGHLVGVPVVISGVLPDGSCFSGGVTFGTAFLARDYPPSPPAQSVWAAPPFATGASLLAEITGRWRLGTIATLPGPGSTAPTFVHIPTCTWLDSTVPLTPTHLHTIKTAQSDGYTFFLVYNITVTPGAVTWDWGDGSTSTSLAVAETPPASLPAYDPSAQTWSDPCTVSHPYDTVSTGRTITANQSFHVDITVSWSDGLATTTQPVACDPASGGACALTVGPAQGWVSGPHPVDQIEPVPFSPASGG